VRGEEVVGENVERGEAVGEEDVLDGEHGRKEAGRVAGMGMAPDGVVAAI